MGKRFFVALMNQRSLRKTLPVPRSQTEVWEREVSQPFQNGITDAVFEANDLRKIKLLKSKGGTVLPPQLKSFFLGKLSLLKILISIIFDIGFFF